MTSSLCAVTGGDARFSSATASCRCSLDSTTYLRAHPGAFRHLTGLVVPVFNALAVDLAPRVEATHRRAIGPAGHSG